MVDEDSLDEGAGNEEEETDDQIGLDYQKRQASSVRRGDAHAVNVIQEEEEDDDSLTRKSGAKKEVKVTVHNKKLLDVLMGGGDMGEPEMVPQK